MLRHCARADCGKQEWPGAGQVGLGYCGLEKQGAFHGEKDPSGILPLKAFLLQQKQNFPGHELQPTAWEAPRMAESQDSRAGLQEGLKYDR